MSLAATAPPVADTKSFASSSERVGILVIESESVTPLGPKIVYANREACELSGYELSSLVGSPLGLIYDHGDLRSLIEKLPVVARRNDFCWMDRALNQNGGYRTKVRWTIRPTNRETGFAKYFTLTISDIPAKVRTTPSPPSYSVSEEKESHHPERTSTDSVTDPRSNTLAITAGGVAHDFKNALQTIKSNLEMAGADVASEDFDRKLLGEYLADAQLALEDAEALARQMVDFTKGNGPTRRVFDLAASLNRIAQLSTAGSRIRNRLRINSSLRAVEGDPDQIYQVFHNLVINARQAMPEGGTIDISAANIDFTTAENQFSVPPGRYSLVSIRDRGCGIAPEHLSRIFSPDYTTKKDGCGFGLASCRSIVENHGGAIRVASKLGIGTEFLVFLPSSEVPVSPAETTQEEALQPKGREKRPRPGTATILVVDDQPGVCRSTCRMLNHFGYNTLVAESGEEALHLFRLHLDSDEPIDLVLLDMTLPGGLHGKDVLKELRKIDRQVRVIATSGYFEDGHSEAISDFGFTGVLAKPYAMDSLALTVSEALS